LDFSYEADVWGRIRNTVQAQIATAQASAADLETARLSIHAELATDYLELRGLDEQQRLFEATVAAYERALELTMNRYNEGVSSGVDVAQAKTQLETAKSQALDIGIMRAQFEHAIAMLIGKTPSEFSISPGSFGAFGTTA
jgi:outer membrane protein TolC